MIEIDLEREWDFSGNEYRELFMSSSATAFQHPEWLAPMYRKLAPQMNAEPITATVRQAGKLIAVVPLMRLRRRGVKIVELADLGVTDYCAPVVRTDAHHAILEYERFSAKLRQLIAPCDILRIKSVRPEHASLIQHMTGIAPQQADFHSHEALLEAPYEQWRAASFGRSQLKNLDRKHRRFERLGDTELELVSDPPQARRAIAELRALRSGRFDDDPIQKDSIHEFYAQVAATGCESGFSRTYRLTENGNTAGIVFGTCIKQRFNYLLIGCDYTKYSKASPGLLMYDRIMGDWIDAGGDIFDFTIGDEAFKADFGTRAIRITTFTKAVSITGHVADSVHSVSRRFA